MIRETNVRSICNSVSIYTRLAGQQHDHWRHYVRITTRTQAVSQRSPHSALGPTFRRTERSLDRGLASDMIV